MMIKDNKLLIESTNNILSPSSGKAIATPTQDMVLGLYYLTVDNPTKKYEDNLIENLTEKISDEIILYIQTL